MDSGKREWLCSRGCPLFPLRYYQSKTELVDALIEVGESVNDGCDWYE